MSVADGSQIRPVCLLMIHVGLRWDMSVSDRSVIKILSWTLLIVYFMWIEAVIVYIPELCSNFSISGREGNNLEQNKCCNIQNIWVRTQLCRITIKLACLLCGNHRVGSIDRRARPNYVGSHFKCPSFLLEDEVSSREF